MRLEVIQGDITTLDVDAIVNAANQKLLGGGGVDGAIHRAAGAGLREECRGIAEVRPDVRCPTGEARITSGHDLTARWVIHAVGPFWNHRKPERSDELLASCYTSALELARRHEAVSIAFPCISTGAYRFPADRAAGIAAATVRAAAASPVERVIFCCFREADVELYRALLG